MLLLCALIVGSGDLWADDYELVTNVSQLSDGDVIIIASGTSGSCYAIGAANSPSNRKAVSVSVSENKITTDVDNENETTGTANTETAALTKPLEITLVASSTKWNLKEVVSNGNVYLNGGYKNNSNKNQNHLKAAASAETATGKNNANGVWTIEVNTTSHIATITNENGYYIQLNGTIFASYVNAQTDVYIYKKKAAKTASNLTITNTENTINLAIGGTTTGDITYTTSSDGTMHFTSNNTSVATVDEYGEVTAVAEGSTTITVSQDEGTSYAASSNLSVTINVSDARTAVGSITATSPTTVYVGQIDDFTLTQSMTGTVSNYAWSLGSGEDAYLTLADETFEGVAEGDVTVTVTATPTDASTYKPVTASFPVSVEYKYAAPSLPAAAVFFSTKSITIPAIAGADVYYTTDGSTPTKLSTKYTVAFEVSATKTVKAIAIDEDGCVSPVASATYTKEDVLDINLTDVTFQDFSGAGNGYDNGAEKNLTFTATDGETKLKITGTNIMSNNGLQVRNTPGTFTTQYIKNAEKAFSLTATFTNGLSYKISYADGSDDTNGTLTSGTAITPNSFPCKFTFTRSNGTPVITKIVLTPLKDPIATGVSITDPGTLAKGETGTFVGASTDVDDCTKAWSSSNESVIEIKDASAGTYEAKGHGTAKITYTITPEDGTTYREVSANINVNVTEPVVITASDVSMTYGDAAEPIGATTSTGYDGTLTYESGNTAIATVDASGKVTAVAVGTTTITISAPADAEHLYTAGNDKVINVTINAPAGGTEAKSVNPVNIVNSTFTSTTWPTGWTQTSTNNDWDGWSATNNGLAGTGYNSGSRYAGTFDLISPEFDLSGYASAEVSFSHAGQYFGTPSEEALLLIKVGDADPVNLTINTYFSNTNWTATTNTTNLDAYVGNTVRLIFRYISDGTSAHCGTWDVKSLKITATPAATISATLNADGYATFCSEYPLDFSSASGYTAWYASAVEGSTITFEKITGSIKGGQGILLKGDGGATVTLNSVDSDVELDDNMLVGCLAPTYVGGDAQNYALVHVDATNETPAHSEFQNLERYTGIMPAGKAYLRIPGQGQAPSAFRIVFEENNATDINSIEESDKAVKFIENGQLYIMRNGVVYDAVGRLIRK